MTALPKILALLAVAAGVSAPAAADEFLSNGRTTAVRYQDLDLSKDTDQRELEARIRRAAVKVCPDRTLRGSRACQLLAIEHVRAPIYAAIAKAKGTPGPAFADKGEVKPVGASQ